MTSPAPLGAIRILDFTRVLSGPYCTAMLADLGAEVIKIESAAGDDQRHMGAMHEGISANFEMINRSKRSLQLDLKSPEAREIIDALALECDVVVENFRPGVAARLGLDAARLGALNPRLVYCSISGFGQSGPLSDLPSYDVVAQAMSGFMSVTGDTDGPPMMAGDSIGDTVAAIFAAFGIATALFRRERTGLGDVIDVSMFDSLLALLPTVVAQYQVTGKAPGRAGNAHPLSAPFGAFRARDNHFILAVANTQLFEVLSRTIGRPELAADPSFKTDQARKANEPKLRAAIEGWAAGLDAEAAIAKLRAAGLPAAPIWSVAEAVDGPQAAARGLFRTIDHPNLGSFRLPEQPVAFASSSRGNGRPAPALGADGADILQDVLGWDEARITAARARGTI